MPRARHAAPDTTHGAGTECGRHLERWTARMLLVAKAASQGYTDRAGEGARTPAEQDVWRSTAS
eukprot:8405272-Pyramimonas_sp.AAC.1